MLASPYTIIRRQRGNSFDYATLLCSLLLGAGYDAYVVSGYASREICNMDQSREICPLLKDDGEVSSLLSLHKPFPAVHLPTSRKLSVRTYYICTSLKLKQKQ